MTSDRLRNRTLPLVCLSLGLVSQSLAAPISFTNLGVFSTNEANFSGIGRLAENPLPWFESAVLSPLPGWDANVRWDWSANYTADFAPVSEEDALIIAAPFVSESTLHAIDEDGNTVGTLSLAGTGILDTDLNFSAALVDNASGQLFTPYSLTETYEITGQTGIYAQLVKPSEWSTEVRGRSARVLFTGQDPPEGATSNAIISSSSTFVIRGEYEIVPEPDMSGHWVVMLAAAMIYRRRNRLG